jgi:hypothetical protein
VDSKHESLIKGALRSIAASVPVASSLAQVWNEYEAVRQNERMDVLFATLRSELLDVRRLQADAVSLEEFPELLERAVSLTKRTHSEQKRKAFVRALVRLVVPPDPIDASDCQTLLDTVDQLTDYDIAILTRFEARDRMRFEELVADVSAPLTGTEYDRIPVAVAKLESRGLITDCTPPPEPTDLNAIYSGGSSSRWVRARFFITAFGRTVLQLLKTEASSLTAPPNSP